MDVGTRTDTGGNVKAGTLATEAGILDTDEEDPSWRSKEMATHNEEEAPSRAKNGINSQGGVDEAETGRDM